MSFAIDARMVMYFNARPPNEYSLEMQRQTSKILTKVLKNLQF